MNAAKPNKRWTDLAHLLANGEHDKNLFPGDRSGRRLRPPSLGFSLLERAFSCLKAFFQHRFAIEIDDRV
jgi:hypothetical protein